MPALSHRIMALARITGAVSGDALDLLACRDLVERVGQDVCGTLGPVALRRLPSPMWLPVISTARTSNVCASIPRKSCARRAVWGRHACAPVPRLRLKLDAGAVDQKVQRPFGVTDTGC